MTRSFIEIFIAIFDSVNLIKTPNEISNKFRNRSFELIPFGGNGNIFIDCIGDFITFRIFPYSFTNRCHNILMDDGKKNIYVLRYLGNKNIDGSYVLFYLLAVCRWLLSKTIRAFHYFKYKEWLSCNEKVKREEYTTEGKLLRK